MKRTPAALMLAAVLGMPVAGEEVEVVMRSVPPSAATQVPEERVWKTVMEGMELAVTKTSRVDALVEERVPVGKLVQVKPMLWPGVWAEILPAISKAPTVPELVPVRTVMPAGIRKRE